MKADTNRDLGKIWGKVKSAMSYKVDKARWMGLSSNDYTAEDKEKVQNISIISNEQIDELIRKECYDGFS